MGKRATKRRHSPASRPLLTVIATRLADSDDVVQGLRSAGLDCEVVALPEDAGLARSLNKAFGQARGKYVCVLGPRDECLPGNLERQVAVLEANPQVGLVYARWNTLNGKGERVSSALPGHALDPYVGGRQEFLDLLSSNHINLATAVFRRNLFERHGGFDERLTTLFAWDAVLRWVRHAETAYLAEPLANVLPLEPEIETAAKARVVAAEKLVVWRKWLFDHKPPIVIDDETWLRMSQFYGVDLAKLADDGTAAVDACRAEFDALRREYLVHMPTRFAATAMGRPSPSRTTGGRPKLSVLIPAYNRPDMLSECLSSLATVTSNCEIVIVDDKSPVDLRPVAERHAQSDPRIRFIRNDTNLGPTGNFNKAISVAGGEYFCILGDDETVLPGNFEKKLAILDRFSDIGFVYSRHYYTDATNRNMGPAQWPGMLGYSYVGGRDEFSDLFPWNYISLHSVVYRKALFERYGGFDEALTECGNDWEMNIRYAFHTATAYIDESLLNVRVHEGATTRRLGLLQSKLAEGRVSVWRKWLVNREPPLVLDERAWGRLRGLYERDLNHWFQGEPEKVSDWLHQFEALRREASVATRRHFAGAAPGAEPEEQSSEVQPEREHRAARIPVTWEGGFFETHSLALANRELASAVLGSGQVELSLKLQQLEPLKFDPRLDPRMAPLVNLVDRPLAQPAAVHIRHAWPPRFERPAAGKWVMIQPWEFGALPVDWIAPMRDQVDEIWAYTEAVRQMYIESGVPGTKVHVVPLGIDPRQFRPDAAPMALPTQKRVRFLFVGGTIWRKGIDILLQAYSQTFTRDDDVCLVVKDMGQDSFYKGQGAGETIARLQTDPRAPEILYATGALADKDMPGLYTACTCLVHPYRGEGFGLPVAEAMASGLPAIITRGGACDEFATDDTVYWVPSARRTFQMEVPTAGPAWVLEADAAALADQMRAVYANPEEARARGQRASTWIRENFTWTAGAQKALARIQALARPPTDDRQEAARSFELGKQCLDAGSDLAAKRHFGRAVELNPALAGAWYLRGVALMNLGQTDEAVTSYEKAIELRPDVSDFHNGLGGVLSTMPDGRVRASQAFHRALELDPSNLSALTNLGEVALLDRDWTELRAVVEKARTLAPADEQVLRLEAELEASGCAAGQAPA